MQSWRLCTSRTRAQNIDLAAVQKLTHRVSQCVPQCAYMGREASASACMPRAAESAALTPRSDRLSPALMRAAGRRVRRVCGGGDRARGQAEAGQRPGPAHHARPAHQRARGGPGARPRARPAGNACCAAHGSTWSSTQHAAHSTWSECACAQRITGGCAQTTEDACALRCGAHCARMQAACMADAGLHAHFRAEWQ